MWARYIEILFGVWLIASPWVFPEREQAWLQTNEIICGVAVIVLAVASFFRPTARAHVLIGAVALWLGGSAYFFEPRPGPPAGQNDITLAYLLILMFLIPNEASKPPISWRDARQG
jgi:hypothetical protein